MNIDRRLENMRERLERSRPCRMTVRLKSGEEIVTNPGGAIRAFQELGLMDEIVDVAADRDDYAELASLLAALCR